MTEDELDALSVPEYDAELLIEYLQWQQLPAARRGLDLGPPGSAAADGSLAADDGLAWAVVTRDRRWAPLGLTVPEAIEATGGTMPAQRWDASQHPRGRDGKFAHSGSGGGVGALSKAYNDVPETRGTPRGKAAVPASGRASADQEAIDAWRAGHPVAPPITRDEARDGARPVSEAEFQALAREGLNQLGVMAANRKPITGLDRHWDQIKAETHAKVLQSWGGATIDAHTGVALPDGADKYALTVKPHGLKPVSIHENPTEAEFSAAMDRAREQFRGELEKGSHYLGIFHDDDEGRIDIDPVVVVDSLHEVETIGSYTHAIGGAYHFKSGDGFWPPYVAEAQRAFNPREARVPGGAGGGRWTHVGAQPGAFTFSGEPGSEGHARAIEALAKVLDREPGSSQTAQVLRLGIRSMVARDLPAAHRHLDGAIYQDQIATEGAHRVELEQVKASLDRVPAGSVSPSRLPAAPPSLSAQRPRDRQSLSPGVVGGDASGAPSQSYLYGSQGGGRRGR